AFGLDDEIVDERAPNEPTCHVPVHVEYRYDNRKDQLAMVRPSVDVDFVDGHCTSHPKDASPVVLARVEAHETHTHLAPGGNSGSKDSIPYPFPPKDVKQADSKPPPAKPPTKSSRGPTAATTPQKTIDLKQQEAAKKKAAANATKKPTTTYTPTSPTSKK